MKTEFGGVFPCCLWLLRKLAQNMTRLITFAEAAAQGLKVIWWETVANGEGITPNECPWQCTHNCWTHWRKRACLRRLQKRNSLHPSDIGYSRWKIRYSVLSAWHLHCFSKIQPSSQYFLFLRSTFLYQNLRAAMRAEAIQLHTET